MRHGAGRSYWHAASAIPATRALLDRTGPGMDARLERLRNRLDVSQRVAGIAAPALAGEPVWRKPDYA